MLTPKRHRPANRKKGALENGRRKRKVEKPNSFYLPSMYDVYLVYLMYTIINITLFLGPSLEVQNNRC